METVLRKSWPTSVPKELHYRLGEKPLHDYLRENAAEHPHQVAYTYYGNDLTWSQLYDKVLRFGNFLKHKGVTKGTKIGLYLQNSPQYLIGHYAIQTLGAIVVPLNPMYKSAELAYFIQEADITIILSGQELYDQIQGIQSSIPSLKHVVTTHYSDFLPEICTLPVPSELTTEKLYFQETDDMQRAIEQFDPIAEITEVNLWEDVCLLVFTSGTTGRPKAAQLTYGNALFKTASSAHAYLVQSEDITLATAPFCHIAGMVMGVNMPVYTQSQCIVFTRFDPEATLQAIQDYQVSKMYTIAAMNAAMLHHPKLKSYHLTSLKLNFSTSFGMVVDEELASAWKEATNGCLLFEAAYGLSETHTCDTFMPIDNIKFGTCGIATYKTHFRIVDPETGKDLEPNEDGEIVIKGPGSFKGYLNREEDTAETMRDGWIYTGDIGMLDQDGYLYFKGRLKEMIKTSGFSVFPEDVEALLAEHEAVYQVAVIGIPDEVKGEKIKAFVVLKPDRLHEISEQQFIDWAKGFMAAYKVPKEVEFKESLPATSSGKILRRLLKDE